MWEVVVRGGNGGEGGRCQGGLILRGIFNDYVAVGIYICDLKNKHLLRGWALIRVRGA